VEIRKMCWAKCSMEDKRGQTLTKKVNVFRWDSLH
jgi:hypothetical protein